LFDKINT